MDHQKSKAPIDKKAETPTQQRALDIARTWIKTPYRHQASLKGAGTDCLGVLRGVWRELYDTEPEAPPPYQPDWYDLRRDDLLLRKAQQYLLPLKTLDLARPGDVLVFRMRPNMAAKHCGILSEAGRMIHALSGRHVEEVTVNRVYWDRCVGAFRFPEE